MGYKTIVIFDNDDLHRLREDSASIMETIYTAAATLQPTRIGGGRVRILRPRHTDNERILYMFNEGTFSEMSPYTTETESLMRNHPDSFEKMLRIMKAQTKELSDRFKEIKAESEE